LSQIQSDLRSVGAFKLAQEDAAKFLQGMKIPSTLTSAASAGGKKLLKIGPFGSSDPIEAPNFSLATPASQAQFLREAFDMLSLVSASNPHPIKQIDLPAGQRVLIAQLTDVLPLWRDGGLPYAQFAADNQQFVQDRHQLALDWFDYDSVASRLNYRSESTKRRVPTALPPVDKVG